MKSAKQIKARDYYLSGQKTQKQIAEDLGISDKTLYLWIKQNAWDQIKKSSYEAPAIIVDNMFSQMAELQNSIASRDPGLRYPTGPEAEITRKLITCILKLKDYPSKSSFIQMMNSYMDYTRNIDPQHTRETQKYADRFFYLENKAGYNPYQVEYGTEYDPISEPVDELDEKDESLSINEKPETVGNMQESITPAPNIEAVKEPESFGSKENVDAPPLTQTLADKPEEQSTPPNTLAGISNTPSDISGNDNEIDQQQVEVNNDMPQTGTAPVIADAQSEITDNDISELPPPTYSHPYYVSPHGRATPRYMWEIFPDYPRP